MTLVTNITIVNYKPLIAAREGENHLDDWCEC